MQRLTRVLGGVLFFALLHIPVHAVQSVTLAWDPSPDPGVAGYRMYYGVASRTYTNMVDVGPATSATVGNLVEGVIYYFAATAYDTLGLESSFSAEISYLIPGGLPPSQIHAVAGAPGRLTMTGVPGQTYDVQVTEDFTTWTVIGTVTLDPSGRTDFTDTDASSFPVSFYRTQKKP